MGSGTVILLRPWNFKIAWSMLSKLLRELRQEKKAEELMPEKTSRTEWMNMITLNPSQARHNCPWNSTGVNTHYHSQMATLARLTSNTEQLLTTPWMKLSASGYHQPSEVISDLFKVHNQI